MKEKYYKPLSYDIIEKYLHQKEVFDCTRHCSSKNDSSEISKSWRIRDRMKTVSVALVVCLNVGVDPPDVFKITPCARLECWIGECLHSGPIQIVQIIHSFLCI